MKYELPSIELIVIEENDYLKFGEYLNDMQCDDTTNKLCLDDLEYVKKLQQENKQLQEKLDKYENPEDMTLMYMWCNEKAKDKIKQLKEVIEKTNNELITLIQIIMEQPSKNVEEDNYLLNRLEIISNILVGGNDDR